MRSLHLRNCDVIFGDGIIIERNFLAPLFLRNMGALIFYLYRCQYVS